MVGTSAGALNAAYLAGHGTGRSALDELAASWVRTRRSEVFPIDPLRHVLALGGSRPSLFPARGLRRRIRNHLTYARLEDAAIELHVIATNLLSGEEVVLSTGDALSAVLASSAIPGVLPPVRRGGLTLVDGALANNAAISVAVGLGAERVFVLPTGYTCAPDRPPASALGVVIHALGFLIEQQLIADVARFAERVDLNVLPPLCPLTVSPIDFRQARSLIARAYASSAHWIDDGGLHRPHPERYLLLHDHTDIGTVAAPVEAVRAQPAGPAQRAGDGSPRATNIGPSPRETKAISPR